MQYQEILPLSSPPPPRVADGDPGPVPQRLLLHPPSVPHQASGSYFQSLYRRYSYISDSNLYSTARGILEVYSQLLHRFKALNVELAPAMYVKN